MKKGTYTQADKNVALVLFWALNIQFILGLALYFVFSPITQAAFGNISEAMADSSLRFFIVEHFVGMFLAIAVGHVGIARAKREQDPARKHKTLADLDWPLFADRNCQYPLAIPAVRARVVLLLRQSDLLIACNRCDKGA